MMSRLLRGALSGTTASGPSPSTPAVAGFRPFPTEAGQLITDEQIDQLRDEAGL